MSRIRDPYLRKIVEPVIGASLARKDGIQIVEDRGDCNEKLLAPVLGPASSDDQAGRFASPFQQSGRSTAPRGIALRIVAPPLPSGQRFSLSSSVELTGKRVFRRVALSGVVTGAPSPR